MGRKDGGTHWPLTIEPLLLLVRVTDATGANPIRAASQAAEHEHVEYAEPNLVHQLRRFAFLPNDPFFSEQWHLFTPSNSIDLVTGAGINTPDAWDITTGSRDIVVCVADDGIDVTHPDFAGVDKIIAPMNVRSFGNGIDIDGNVLPRPGDYHGTPCAGVAVAELNDLGTAGVAPGSALLPVRFPLSISDDNLAQMFERISAQADIVSCSWGFGPTQRFMSTNLDETVQRLSRTGGRRGQGLIFCVAAGNNNCPVVDLENTRIYRYLDRFGFTQSYSGPIYRWLAAHPDVITVSASTSLKTRSAYSSWGREISVCAPSNNFDDLNRFNPRGRGIVTTDNEGFGNGTDFTPNSRYTD